MRQLSKVVFINGAGIRYGEVRLDGNVHLIGTQGVGKSTVLRAILFFYTGDKTRLGISREKKSFDDFYLPGADSYLAYEVETEFGAFTLLVFRRHARSVFRFIGAPFSRDWLVGEDGRVTADHSLIRQRLGGAPMTRIVDEYQEYRDILYGNRAVTEKAFHPYCIMESAKYQNIPRSLQNVFLGAKVDADFIKDIIIRSLGDEEPGIDLVYFRGQLSEFEREYRDILQWFDKDKGEIKVRSLADRLIEEYRRLLYLDDELQRAILELRFSRRRAEERIPLAEKEAEALEVQIDKHREKLAELADKYRQELSGLDEELGIVKDALEKIPKLRKKYEALDIARIIEEDGQEEALKAELEGERQLRERLTREYADISAKYADRESALKLGFEGWKAARSRRIIEIGEAYNGQIAKVIEALQQELGSIEEAFSERELALKNQLTDLRERLASADKQLAVSAHLRPYQTEMENIRTELARLRSEDRALEASEKSAQAQVDAAVKDGQYEQDRLAREYDEKLGKLSEAINGLTLQINDIQAFLDTLDGSLIQWLSQNKTDWAVDIGKVTGEKILYAKNLYPSLKAGDSLFGVDLDLSRLKTQVRTPEQLMNQKLKLEKDRAAVHAEWENLLAEKEADLQSLKKKWAGKIKTLREELSGIRTVRLMLPAKLTVTENQKALYEQRTLEAREEARAKYQEEMRALTAERVLAEDALKKLLEQKAAERTKAQENEARHRKSLKLQHDEALAAVEKEIMDRETELKASLQVLSKDREQELSGQGADTRALERCEGAIHALEARLEGIGKNKETLFRYRQDKENYFDRKDGFASQKKVLEGKKAGLQDRYNLKRRKGEDALNTALEALRLLKEELKTLKEGLESARNFEESNPQPLLPQAREAETDKTCRQLIDEIHKTLSDRRSTENTFRDSVTAFTGCFSPGNVFGFRTDNRTDEDCRTFAAQLEEFIGNDKIEEFRRRTSGHYADLLLRISHEMDEVSRNSSEIAGIVRDINFDFKEKNFIGAVRSIELRTVPSSNRLVVLLQEIKQFVGDHGFGMGEVNLFGADKRDQVNTAAVEYLLELARKLGTEHLGSARLTLGDTFEMQFRIRENDNDTGWVEKISSVGSDGTDVLVKAMVNIMLINVFKERVSGRFKDFRLHCVMDEIGRLHPRNVRGILDFAGARNIYLVNGSPVPYNVADYKHTYLLTKEDNHTVIQSLLSRKEAAVQ
ncbi:MAG: ATP-binding protein [Bacteroidales bacterium]|nr:ATP-binding protein [Bacteroidales bacterium]